MMRKSRAKPSTDRFAISTNPIDYTEKYNTPLSPVHQQLFDKMATRIPELKNATDYDIQGWWHSIITGPGRGSATDKIMGSLPKNGGHYTDQFKKPNHYTFSTLSQYHGADDHEGGRWAPAGGGKWSFTPGATNRNLHGAKNLRRYWEKFEQPAGNALLLSLARNHNVSDENLARLQKAVGRRRRFWDRPESAESVPQAAAQNGQEKPAGFIRQALEKLKFGRRSGLQGAGAVATNPSAAGKIALQAAADTVAPGLSTVATQAAGAVKTLTGSALSDAIKTLSEKPSSGTWVVQGNASIVRDAVTGVVGMLVPGASRVVGTMHGIPSSPKGTSIIGKFKKWAPIRIMYDKATGRWGENVNGDYEGDQLRNPYGTASTGNEYVQNSANEIAKWGIPALRNIGLKIHGGQADGVGVIVLPEYMQSDHAGKPLVLPGKYDTSGIIKIEPHKDEGAYTASFLDELKSGRMDDRYADIGGLSGVSAAIENEVFRADTTIKRDIEQQKNFAELLQNAKGEEGYKPPANPHGPIDFDPNHPDLFGHLNEKIGDHYIDYDDIANQHYNDSMTGRGLLGSEEIPPSFNPKTAEKTTARMQTRIEQESRKEEERQRKIEEQQGNKQKRIQEERQPKTPSWRNYLRGNYATRAAMAGGQSVYGPSERYERSFRTEDLARLQKAVTPAWQRKEGQNPKGGLNAKGRASAKREGHNLKPPVKSGDNPRRASFLARMGGSPGPEYDEKGKPTRLLLALRVWGASSKADAKRKAKAISGRLKVKKSLGQEERDKAKEITYDYWAALHNKEPDHLHDVSDELETEGLHAGKFGEDKKLVIALMNPGEGEKKHYVEWMGAMPGSISTLMHPRTKREIFEAFKRHGVRDIGWHASHSSPEPKTVNTGSGPRVVSESGWEKRQRAFNLWRQQYLTLLRAQKKNNRSDSPLESLRRSLEKSSRQEFSESFRLMQNELDGATKNRLHNVKGEYTSPWGPNSTLDLWSQASTGCEHPRRRVYAGMFGNNDFGLLVHHSPTQHRRNEATISYLGFNPNSPKTVWDSELQRRAAGAIRRLGFDTLDYTPEDGDGKGNVRAMIFNRMIRQFHGLRGKTLPPVSSKIQKAIRQNREVADVTTGLHTRLAMQEPDAEPGQFYDVTDPFVDETATHLGKFGPDGGMIVHLRPHDSEWRKYIELGRRPKKYTVEWLGSKIGSPSGLHHPETKKQFFDAMRAMGVKNIGYYASIFGGFGTYRARQRMFDPIIKEFNEGTAKKKSGMSEYPPLQKSQARTTSFDDETRRKLYQGMMARPVQKGEKADFTEDGIGYKLEQQDPMRNMVVKFPYNWATQAKAVIPRSLRDYLRRRGYSDAKIDGIISDNRTSHAADIQDAESQSKRGEDVVRRPAFFFAPGVHQSLMRHMESGQGTTPIEKGAVLLGSLSLDPESGSPFVEVSHAIPEKDVIEYSSGMKKQPNWREGADAGEIRKILEKNPHMFIVGHAHAHPAGFSPRLSSGDVGSFSRNVRLIHPYNLIVVHSASTIRGKGKDGQEFVAGQAAKRQMKRAGASALDMTAEGKLVRRPYFAAPRNPYVFNPKDPRSKDYGGGAQTAFYSGAQGEGYRTEMGWRPVGHSVPLEGMGRINHAEQIQFIGGGVAPNYLGSTEGRRVRTDIDGPGGRTERVKFRSALSDAYKLGLNTTGRREMTAVNRPRSAIVRKSEDLLRLQKAAESATLHSRKVTRRRVLGEAARRANEALDDDRTMALFAAAAGTLAPRQAVAAKINSVARQISQAAKFFTKKEGKQ